MSAPVDPAPLIGIPPGWSTLDEAPPPTGFVALEDEPGPLFQANLVVTTELVEVDLAGWQEHVDDMLADILNDYVLIDWASEVNRDADQLGEQYSQPAVAYERRMPLTAVAARM